MKSLVKEIKESQHFEERIDTTLTRIKKGFLKSAKEQGKKIGLAIVEDAAEKIGLKQTLEVGKDIVQSIREEKTGLQLAQGYVSEHKDEARESYIEILYTLADEFKDRNFVLIFDQFEYAGKASVDFLLNFIKLNASTKNSCIVSFRTDDRTKTEFSYLNFV